MSTVRLIAPGLVTNIDVTFGTTTVQMIKDGNDLHPESVATDNHGTRLDATDLIAEGTTRISFAAGSKGN